MINQFSSIFEIFTGLNLAYAGSKTFRDALDQTILQIGNTITNNHEEKIKKIQSEITVTIAEEYEQQMQEKCSTVNRYFRIYVKRIKDKEEHYANFPIGIKSIFLLTSLFCFTLLIIGGYEQFYSDEKTNEFLTFLNIIILFIIYIFIRNLFPSKFNKKIKPLYTLLLFLFPILMYSAFVKYTADNNNAHFQIFEIRINVMISILISISAFLFHFLRVYIHRVYFRYQLLKIYNKTESELREFELSIDIIKSINKKNRNPRTKTEWIFNFRTIFKALKRDSD